MGFYFFFVISTIYILWPFFFNNKQVFILYSIIETNEFFVMYYVLHHLYNNIKLYFF